MPFFDTYASQVPSLYHSNCLVKGTRSESYNCGGITGSEGFKSILFFSEL